MNPGDLDSRSALGSDIDRAHRAPPQEAEEFSGLDDAWIETRHIHVVLGKFATFVRLWAPDLDIIVDGASFEEAWSDFIAKVQEQPDSDWLTFDVAPTRPEEISAGLDVSEDEALFETDGFGDE